MKWLLLIVWHATKKRVPGGYIARWDWLDRRLP